MWRDDRPFLGQVYIVGSRQLETCDHARKSNGGIWRLVDGRLKNSSVCEGELFSVRSEDTHPHSTRSGEQQHKHY
jgi:hypothetical protein